MGICSAAVVMSVVNVIAPRPRPSPSDLLDRLRQATADAHNALETSLDLLREPPEKRRFVALLRRFYGFHAAWEPAVYANERLGTFMASRSRLRALRQDLHSLGVTDDPRRLPRCHEAAGLVGADAGLIGSAYVMEGSTLGGQVLMRRLAQAAWAPTGGVAYFNPYGARTGEMWRAFRAWARTAAEPLDPQAIEDAAVRTFRLLQDWLCEEKTP